MIGYFMSYQSLYVQFTLIPRDLSKQRNYASGRARFSATSVTSDQILVRILQFITFTACGAFGAYGFFGPKRHSDRFFHFICFHESSVRIVLIMSIVSIVSIASMVLFISFV